MPVGTVVDVIVQARRGFVLIGKGEESLTITDVQETLPLQFKFRSPNPEFGQIRACPGPP